MSLESDITATVMLELIGGVGKNDAAVERVSGPTNSAYRIYEFIFLKRHLTKITICMIQSSLKLYRRVYMPKCNTQEIYSQKLSYGS